MSLNPLYILLEFEVDDIYIKCCEIYPTKSKLYYNVYPLKFLYHTTLYENLLKNVIILVEHKKIFIVNKINVIFNFCKKITNEVDVIIITNKNKILSTK